MSTSLFDDSFPFIGLFRAQAGALEGAVKQLESMVRDFAAVPDKCARIGLLVSEGEAACRKLEREFSLTFMEPLDREDIRELNRAFERTLQAVGAVSSRLGLYGFRAMQKGAASQVACLAEMTAQIAPLLDVVVREGNATARLERVRRLKREADTFLLLGMGEMYEAAESGVENVLETLKWSQVYDRLEEVASCLEHVVNLIEGIILKKV